MLETFSIETFAPLADDAFVVRLEAGPPLELRLVEVESIGAADATSGRVPFSIVFRGPAGPILPQRIHSLEHPRLGAFDLFIVPLQPDAAGSRYQAIFT
ncbi:MAG: hypothetical protein QOE44_1803 [Solirubrobacteraceae bacterium]|jgi:hypothetical protein|nr:hypothetical protein [Solirubrobacteraceae bacterium]